LSTIFSEVNTELVDELKTQLATGNTQSANDIANSIKENAKKIYHHGKRADAIVKNMLQHSRASRGQKELPILINLPMNICDWRTMDCVQKTNHSMRNSKRNFDHRHWEK
jgi:hypothetical protein